MSALEQPTRKPFNNGRNDTCFCGSGKKFKACCGSLSSNRNPPHGVVVIENYLTPEQCADIIGFANQQDSERLKVVDLEKTTEDEVVRKLDDTRVTERVDMSGLQQKLNQLVKDALECEVEPAVKDTVSWFEEPQLLKYTPGGFYMSHSDSENFDPERNLWRKDLDRDISLLLYLSDEFEGGYISFDNFNYKIKPKAGTLIYFPSDSRYLHTAMPVTSGTRYAIVSWSSLESVSKVRKSPPATATYKSDV